MNNGIGNEGHFRELFESITEASPDLIYFKDTDHRLVHVGETYADIFDKKPEKLVGEHTESLWPDRAEEILEDERRALKGEKITDRERLVTHPNGEKHWYSVNKVPRYDEDGNVVGFFAIDREITEQKERERELRRERNRIRAITGAIPDVVIVYEESGNVLEVLTGQEELLAAPEEELIGTKPSEILEPETAEKIVAGIERAIEKESVQTVDYSVTIDGEERWFEGRLAPLSGPETNQVVLAARDLTEEHERVNEIRRLSEYRRVLSRVNQLLVRRKDSGRMLQDTANLIASSDLFGCTFIGLDRGSSFEFVHNSESELTADDVAEFHNERYFDTVFGQETLHIEDVTQPPFVQHRDEQPAHAGVAIAITHTDRKYGILTVHFPQEVEPDPNEIELLEQLADDIGFFLHNREIERKRREHEREVEKQKQQYQSLFDSIRDAIVVVDNDRRITNCNPAFSELFGYELGEIEGNSVTCMCKSGRDFAELFDTLEAGTGDSNILENIDFERKSGQTFPGETSVFHLSGADGKIIGFVALIRDVSDREDRIQQMKVIDRVLRHNVHNNMNVIEGFAHTIQEEATGDLADYAGKIVANSEDLLETVDKEREITKFLSGPPTKENIDLVSIVDSAVSGIRNKHPKADISTEMPIECRVTATRSLGKAIEELLENAIVHSNRENPSVGVQVERDRNKALVHVADNGPGIPTMERNVLTGEAEIQPLYHGSGLGLWLVNLIVRVSNGTMTFDENEPCGSVVSIELPRD